MHNTINNFQGLAYIQAIIRPIHYIELTTKKKHTLVHILIQERELTPL
jgi:hypothetical protein